jgi:hypothetical protein
MEESTVFQALMQFTQYNLYTKQLSPETAVSEAKSLVENMISSAKKIAEENKSQPTTATN